MGQFTRPCTSRTSHWTPRPVRRRTGHSWHPRQGKVDWNESNFFFDFELFRATAVEYDRSKEKPCWIVLAEQRLEAEINVAEILKNGWAWSRLEFKNGTKTNPQGFGECAAKALKYATGYTGEPQDWLLKEWTARALYRWLRRKKDSGKFIKRVAAKWGLGEEQFKEAWKTAWESIRANNIIKGFKWRLLKKVLPASDRLSQGLVDAVWNCPLCGICQETVEHMSFQCREIKAAYGFWFVQWLTSACHQQEQCQQEQNSRVQTWSLEWRTSQEARRQTRSHQCFYTQYG